MSKEKRFRPRHRWFRKTDDLDRCDFCGLWRDRTSGYYSGTGDLPWFHSARVPNCQRWPQPEDHADIRVVGQTGRATTALERIARALEHLEEHLTGDLESPADQMEDLRRAALNHRGEP